MLECIICKESKPCSLPQFSCKHIFCASCTFEYLKLRILENKVDSMPCPHPNCPYNITDDELLKIVGPDLFSKFKLFSRNSILSLNPNLRFCPNADCSGYDIGSSKKQKLTCNVCNFNFCYYCNETWHLKSMCRNSLDIKFDLWSVKNNVKYCPSCKRRIEKAGGCPAIECPVCKAKWCWYCGKDLVNGHDPVLCVFIKDSWELRYWFIVFLIFGPATVPFGLGMFLIHLSQNYLTDSDKESKFISKVIKWKWVTYPVIIVISPLLTVAALAGSGFLVVYVHRSVFKPYRNGCYSKTFRSKYSRYALMCAIACTVTGVLSSLSLAVIMLTPVIGIGFLIGKIVSDVRARRYQKSEMARGYIEI